MTQWTEWEVIRRRVSLGGVVTTDGQRLVGALVELASATDDALQGDVDASGQFEGDGRRDHGFRPANTKYNGYFFVLDLAPGTYVLRCAKPAETKTWTRSIVKVPKKRAEGSSIIWKNIEVSSSQ